LQAGKEDTVPQVVIENPSREELDSRGVNDWPIWTKEVSRFDWYYDTAEQCYLLEGEVTVETREGDFTVKAGDFVTFRQGLKCVWDIKKPVKKHYKFG
jgi:uncharacterized cupin superfamily protein